MSSKQLLDYKEVYVPLPENIREGEVVCINEHGVFTKVSRTRTPKCNGCGRFTKSGYLSQSRCCPRTTVTHPETQLIIGRVLKVDTNGNGWMQLHA